MVDTKVYSTILLFPLAGAVTADKATPYTNALAFRRTPGCASNPTTVLVWAGLQTSARAHRLSLIVFAKRAHVTYQKTRCAEHANMAGNVTIQAQKKRFRPKNQKTKK